MKIYKEDNKIFLHLWHIKYTEESQHQQLHFAFNYSSILLPPE